MDLSIIILDSNSFKTWDKLLKIKIFTISWCFFEDQNQLILIEYFPKDPLDGGGGETEIFEEDKKTIHSHMWFLIL